MTLRRLGPSFIACLVSMTPAFGADVVAYKVKAQEGPRIFDDVPDKIDPSARYIVYVHGRILESQGRHAVSPDFGPYEYDAILQAFAERGFVVIGEVREGDLGLPFVHKVAGQVRRLLEAGVPPQHVTVVGASKGGFLTLEIAAELGLPELSFVILAGCGTYSEPLALGLRGRMLSIFDSADRNSPSCQQTFKKAPKLGEHREIVLTLGLDHGLLYRPYKEWVEPACAWAGAR